MPSKRIRKSQEKAPTKRQLCVLPLLPVAPVDPPPIKRMPTRSPQELRVICDELARKFAETHPPVQTTAAGIISNNPRLMAMYLEVQEEEKPIVAWPPVTSMPMPVPVPLPVPLAMPLEMPLTPPSSSSSSTPELAWQSNVLTPPKNPWADVRVSELTTDVYDKEEKIHEAHRMMVRARIHLREQHKTNLNTTRMVEIAHRALLRTQIETARTMYAHTGDLNWLKRLNEELENQFQYTRLASLNMEIDRTLLKEKQRQCVELVERLKLATERVTRKK